jgi:hypothetical protein
MVTFAELYEQNHIIAERIKIINYLVKDRLICDSEVTRDLFFDLTSRVKNHMDVEERELYKDLLTHSDQKVKQTAENFLSGAVEIRRVFKQYLKRWSHNNQLRIKNHEQFVQETHDILNMIEDRIINETEKFYPVVRNVSGDKIKAA